MSVNKLGKLRGVNKMGEIRRCCSKCGGYLWKQWKENLYQCQICGYFVDKNGDKVELPKGK